MKRKNNVIKSRSEFPFRLPVLFLLAILVGAAALSCASPPVYPEPPPPLTAVLPLGFEDAFHTTRRVLKDDPRLVLDTIDNAGRFIAVEKTGGFIFFRHRTVLDIRLEPAETDQTKLTMRLSAEDYEMGGLTRPAGWYPSSEVDIFLGEDILNIIESKASG